MSVSPAVFCGRAASFVMVWKRPDPPCTLRAPRADVHTSSVLLLIAAAARGAATLALIMTARPLACSHASGKEDEVQPCQERQRRTRHIHIVRYSKPVRRTEEAEPANEQAARARDKEAAGSQPRDAEAAGEAQRDAERHERSRADSSAIVAIVYRAVDLDISGIIASIFSSVLSGILSAAKLAAVGVACEAM